jgi:hypothetical protein
MIVVAEMNRSKVFGTLRPVLHVDDLVEPGTEQVPLSRLPPFPWLHLVSRQSFKGG